MIYVQISCIIAWQCMLGTTFKKYMCINYKLLLKSRLMISREAKKKQAIHDKLVSYLHIAPP